MEQAQRHREAWRWVQRKFAAPLGHSLLQRALVLKSTTFLSAAQRLLLQPIGHCSAHRASFGLTKGTLLTPSRRDDRMHLKGAAFLLTVILLASTHVQALQYSYQPGRRLLQCTTQAACIARCPAGNSPIYLAPQGGASGQCVCICQPTQSSPIYQNSPNSQNSPASQQGGSSGQQQDSASLQSTPVRSGGGLINTNVGGSGGSGSSNFGTLGSGLSGGSSTGSSGYGSGAVTSSSGGSDYGSASQSSSQGSATSALVGAVTSTSGSGAGSGSSSSTSTGSVSSSGSSARTGSVGAVGSGR